MRKGIWKKGMAAVVTAALMAGNVGTYGADICSVVKAVDIEYVPLNQEFESKSTTYFQLTEGGVVSFDTEVDVYQVADDGNETLIHDYYYYYNSNAFRLRLPKGVYKTKDRTISKINFQAETSTTVEKEWNNSFDTANEIQPNIAYTGNLNLYYVDGWDDYDTKDKDYYKFELSQNGTLQLQYSIEDLLYGTSSSDSGNVNIITLYSEDEDFNVTKICSIGSTNDKTKYSNKYRLPKGVYYISVAPYTNDNYMYCNISDYQLKVNYEPESSTDHEQEYNDTIATANVIGTNTNYTGNIPTEADKDYYKFTLPTTSRVKLKTTVPRQSTDGLFHAVLYKEDGSNKIADVKTTTNPVAYTEEQLLEAGTYYVMVEKGSAVKSTVDYSVQVIANEVVVVNSISISPGKTPAYVGDTISMVATVGPENAENKTLTWESSDKTVATVDANGKVTCVGAGNAYITATATDGSGVSGNYLLNVSKILVSGISITAPSNQVLVGEKVQLTATIQPDNAMNKNIIWDSSDTEIATVSEDGRVSCKKKGTVVITATAEDESRITGTITLQITDSATEVTPSAAPATQQPEVTNAPADGTDPTATPEVTIVPVATATPEVTTVPVATATPEVTTVPVATATPEVTTVPTATVTPKPGTEETITTQQPTTTENPADGTTETSAPKETTAPTDDDFSADLIKSIELESNITEEEELRVGDTINLYAIVTPEELEEEELEWTSSNEKVAIVDADGFVECVGAGKVTIKVTATDGSGVTAKRTFTILKAKSKNNYLSKVAISQGKLTPAFKKTRTSYTLTLSKKMSKVIIKATKSDSKAKIKINGKSTNKVVVKLKSGKSKLVTIKVTAENGKTKVYKIKVKRK